MKRRRLLRLVLIVLAVLGFTAYFAFSTFLFSPLEKRYPYDVATLAPRDVDFFVAKADLAADFTSDLTPVLVERLAEDEVGALLLESPEWRSIVAGLGADGLNATIKAELDKLPLGIDPLEVFGGRDVALAGYLDGSSMEQARWALYGRANWMGKLGVELLNYPGLIGLDSQGIEVAESEGALTLSGGQLTRPLTIARVSDVVVVSNDPSLIAGAQTYRDTAGQDSLGQSARYHDQIQIREREGDEFELLLRYATLAPRLGWPMSKPDATSQEWGEAFLGKLFQAELVRDLAGTARLGSPTSLDLSGALVSENLSSFQKRLYRRKDADQLEVARKFARLAPPDTGLFAYLEGDLGDLLREFFASLEVSLVKNFEAEVVAPVWGHSDVSGLIAEFEAAFRDNVVLMVKGNTYQVDEGSAPSDGQPVPIWALALGNEDPERIEALRAKVTQNTARLGLRGKPREGGTYEAGVYELVNSAGMLINEYWSPVIPGTGHMASVETPDYFIVSNNWQFLDEITKGYYGTNVATLADRRDFVATVAGGLPSATLLAWIDPQSVEPSLLEIFRQKAEDDALRDVDWAVERERIGREILARDHPAERWGALSDDLELLVQNEIDGVIDTNRDAMRRERVPKLFQEYTRRVKVAAGLRGVLLQLRLEPKEFELTARFLTATKP